MKLSVEEKLKVLTGHHWLVTFSLNDNLWWGEHDYVISVFTNKELSPLLDLLMELHETGDIYHNL